MACFCALTVFAAGCGNDGDGNQTVTNNTNPNNTNPNNTNPNNTNPNNTNPNNTNPNNTNPNNNSPLTFEIFAKQSQKLITEYICEGVYECPEKQPLIIFAGMGRFADKEECIAQLANELWDGDRYQSERKSLGAGRLEFDPAAAKECLNALIEDAKVCGPFGEHTEGPLRRCEVVLVPKVEKGDACMKEMDCVSRNCDFSESACYGRCGEPIKKHLEGEACFESNCAIGLFCVAAKEANGNQTCIQPKSRKIGEPCSRYYAVCEDNHVCNADHVCGKKPALASAGQACDMTSLPCKPGLVCADVEFDTENYTVTGTCAPPRDIGGDCTLDVECKVGLHCDGSYEELGKCRAPKSAGQECNASVECEGRLICDDESYECAESTYVCELPAK